MLPEEGAHCIHKVELEARARQYLESLGFADHSEAHGDPVYALFQVASNASAQANGYRELYERLRGAGERTGSTGEG